MSRRLKADIGLAFGTLIWGVTFVVVKDALASASVFVFMALRFTLAAVVMAMIFREGLGKLDRAALGAGALTGCFLFAGHAFQTIGLQFTTPSKAAFITALSVVIVPVTLGIFGRRRIGMWVWAGAFAALVGLYFLTVPRAGFSKLNIGDLFALACAVMFAIHIIVVGHFSRNHSVAAFSFLQVAMTALLTLVALPLFAVTGWDLPRLRWNSQLGFAIVLTAIGATAIAYSIQVWAQRFTTATHTAIIFSLEPVFAGLTSFLLARERLGPRTLAGAALIFAGILLAELKGPTQAAAESPGPVGDSR
ncbi:MAG: DMT family transporter [Candidatus Acidiferrales bacterium]